MSFLQTVFGSGHHKNYFITDEGFKAWIDVSDFQPSEVAVKTADQTITVEGKHEVRDDGFGEVERQFVRKYTLPIEYHLSTVNATMSSDGILTLKAPLPKAISGKEYKVSIAQTGAPVYVKK